MSARESTQLPQEMGEIDQENIEGYRTAFDSGGLSELKKKVNENMDKWRNVPVNIAITGESGVGKSSFINSFRGLGAHEEGAATVGVVEMTVEPKKYVHPKNNNLALWDLPGVGTPKFPKKDYLQEIDYKKYDFFLILTAGRFKKKDLWLATEVRKIGKQFFFVRTKMDIDVQSEIYDKKYDNPSLCKAETIKKVRKSITTQAETDGFENVEVFLIDNRSPKEYDFTILQETLIKNAPRLKREAMTYSLTNLTEDLIHMKRDALRNRILVVSLVSGVGGAVPLPGFSLTVDTNIIMQECQFYKEQFGLDDDSLKQNAKELNMSVEHLKAETRIRSHILGTSIKETLAFVGTLAVSEAAETITSIMIPIIGSVISAIISYGGTVVVLRSILDAFVTDALAISKLLMKHISNSSEV